LVDERDGGAALVAAGSIVSAVAARALSPSAARRRASRRARSPRKMPGTEMTYEAAKKNLQTSRAPS
jgi:hypothetical protein